jgi:hypothetical protein
VASSPAKRRGLKGLSFEYSALRNKPASSRWQRIPVSYSGEPGSIPGAGSNTYKMIKYPEYKYGEIVILDKEYHNSSKVKVIRQSEHSRIYTTAQDLETKYKWDVMTNRLTKNDTI